MGCFTAAGMLVMLGRLGAAAPTAGFGLELDAIVAVVIGGASFRGGEGPLRRHRHRRRLPGGAQQRPLRPADGRRRLLPDQGLGILAALILRGGTPAAGRARRQRDRQTEAKAETGVHEDQALETFLANAGQRNYLFVRLTTDTGLTGIGEATLEWQEKAVEVLLNEWVASRIIGRIRSTSRRWSAA